MEKLIIQYEKEIAGLRVRKAELEGLCRTGGDTDSLARRIELIQDEITDMMYSVMLMRRWLEPVRPSPSVSATNSRRDTVPEGDAAC